MSARRKRPSVAASSGKRLAKPARRPKSKSKPPKLPRKRQSPAAPGSCAKRCRRDRRTCRLKPRPSIEERQSRRGQVSRRRAQEKRKIAAAPPPRTAKKIELGKSSSRPSRSRSPIASRSKQYVNRRRRCAAFIGRPPTFRLLAPSSGAGSGGQEIDAAATPAVVSRRRGATRCGQVIACGAFRGGTIIPAGSIAKIYRANRSVIRNPDLIYPCQSIFVPRRH